jgi:hypothetical protein
MVSLLSVSCFILFLILSFMHSFCRSHNHELTKAHLKALIFDYNPMLAFTFHRLIQLHAPIQVDEPLIF